MAKYYEEADGSVWLDVGRENPCPCCGGVRGCGILINGDFVHCLTVVSQWPVVAGGWLHFSEEQTAHQNEELSVPA